MTEMLLAAGLLLGARLGERVLRLPGPDWNWNGLLDGLGCGLLLGAPVPLATFVGPTPGLLALLSSLVLGPFTEERFFRAFLARGVGAVPSSVLFGYVHGGDSIHWAGYTLVGLLFARLFARRGLAAAVGFHAGLNACVL